MHCRRSISLALLVLFCCLALPAASGAAQPESYVRIPALIQSGPAACNQLGILKIGNPRARNVLVLVPGFLGGSGDFRVLGRRLAASFRSLQVWAVDRRSQCLEDARGFQGADPTQALGYYFFGTELGGNKFAAPLAGDPGVEAARNWGLSLTLSDIRAVVLAAKKLGGKVVLGGHSLGGSLTSLYASWDFSGTPGYRDLAGMVLIDGAARGAFGAAPDRSKILADLQALQEGLPFAQILPGAPTYYTGVLPEIAALYSSKNPKANSALQGLLNNVGFGAFTRPVAQGRLNNESGLAYAFDRDTSPAAFELFHLNMGRLRESAGGGAAGWQDGGLTDVADLKVLFGARTGGWGDFVEWYFPRKLSIEVGAATGLTRNTLTDELGLRPWHARNVNVPLYAFETGLTCQARPKIVPGNAASVTALARWVAANRSLKCNVLQGALATKSMSRIAKATFVSDHDQEHLDPLVARSRSNRFQLTVVPFLRSLAIS